MTIPARGCLVLRRLAGKRPPQHSVEQNGGIVGVQTQAFSSDCADAFGIGQRCRYDGGLGGGKWEMSVERKGVTSNRAWRKNRRTNTPSSIEPIGMMEDHSNISERQVRPAGSPRRVRFTLTLVFVGAVILCVARIARIYRNDAQQVPAADRLVEISKNELVKRFRQALDSYENMTDEFRGCVLEIERRRL